MTPFEGARVATSDKFGGWDMVAFIKYVLVGIVKIIEAKRSTNEKSD